jgi:hypothetical protein
MRKLDKSVVGCISSTFMLVKAPYSHPWGKKGLRLSGFKCQSNYLLARLVGKPSFLVGFHETSQ